MGEKCPHCGEVIGKCPKCGEMTELTNIIGRKHLDQEKVRNPIQNTLKIQGIYCNTIDRNYTDNISLDDLQINGVLINNRRSKNVYACLLKHKKEIEVSLYHSLASVYTKYEFKGGNYMEHCNNISMAFADMLQEINLSFVHSDNITKEIRESKQRFQKKTLTFSQSNTNREKSKGVEGKEK